MQTSQKIGLPPHQHCPGRLWNERFPPPVHREGNPSTLVLFASQTLSHPAIQHKRIYADNFCLKICQIAIKSLGFFYFTWQGKCSATHFVKRLTVCLKVGWSLPIWAWPLSCPTGRNLSFLCSTTIVIFCDRSVKWNQWSISEMPSWKTEQQLELKL